MIAQDLARVGIVAGLAAPVLGAMAERAIQGQFDMTLINHVEPLDYRIYTDPGYYFGYDSPAFRDLVQRHAAAANARAPAALGPAATPPGAGRRQRLDQVLN